jgi:hypothetical protein
MPEEGEKNNDRNRNAQQPKQDSATHDDLLIGTGYFNAFAPLWLLVREAGAKRRVGSVACG